jgi:hypothetical protein
MASRDWLPGDMIVVLPSSLVSRVDSNEEQWTRGNQLGLVVAQAHRWESPNVLQMESHRWYVVFFAHVDHGLLITPSSWRNDVTTGFYEVPGNRTIDPSEVNNPGRLFGPWRPTR